MQRWYTGQQRLDHQCNSMIVSNTGYNVDSKNKNIHIRELELSIEKSDYVSMWDSKCQFDLLLPAN